MVESTGTRAASSRGEAPRARSTRQRAEVQRALIETDGFVGAQALHAAMLAAGSGVGLTTVYRALAALAQQGRADTIRDADGERLYRHRPGTEHRHYLICRACGKSEPVETAAVEEWAEKLARLTGFTEVRHTLELDGICALCRSATS